MRFSVERWAGRSDRASRARSACQSRIRRAGLATCQRTVTTRVPGTAPQPSKADRLSEGGNRVGRCSSDRFMAISGSASSNIRAWPMEIGPVPSSVSGRLRAAASCPACPSRPFFDDLPIYNAVDADSCQCHLFARRGNSHELALVCPTPRPATGDLVPLRDDVLSGTTNVSESIEVHPQELLVALAIS
jgi:hypothetical protein